MRAGLAALLLAGGLAAGTGHAQQAGPRIEVLQEGRQQIALCNATSAIGVVADSTDRDSLSLGSIKRSVEIERITLQPDGTVQRRWASIFPGALECLDDHIATYLGVNAGHTFNYFLRWPRNAEAPVELQGAADLVMSGPGLVFIFRYPSETLQQTRARLPGDHFLMLPDGLWDSPRSSVRAGMSPAGAPLLLGILGTGHQRKIAISIIEAGRDPVAVHQAQLRIDGVTEELLAAVLSTWRARPALRFAYRVPDDRGSLVIGAATCDPPRALSDDVVNCQPLVRVRVPSEARDHFEQAWEADRSLVAIAEDGTRAFVTTTDLKRSCLRVVPLGKVVDGPSACVLEVDGWVKGLGAVSDHEALLLVTEGENDKQTVRLLRVRTL